MRPILALAAMLALTALAPAASAAQCPPMCVTAGATPTTPTPGCGDCVGLDAHTGILAPRGCVDCTTLGAHVGVQHDGDGTTVSAHVCRGGFIYICPVDEDITV